MSALTDQPVGVLSVVPARISTFYAAQWNGEEQNYDIEWLAERFGWRVRLEGDALLLNVRNGKRVRVRRTQWVIAVNNNGSVRVVSDADFHTDYKEDDR